MKIGLFYKNITVLDYAILDHNLGVVGGSLKVNIELIGKTDDEGIVFDFSLAKKKIKEIIDLECDHRLIVPKGSFNIAENQVDLKFQFASEGKEIVYKCPREGICEIDSSHVDNAGIQYFLETLILKEMPTTVEAVKISFDEEETTNEQNYSFFHYTHGLKEHYGNCQRLFHGHRNIVEIFIANQRCYELEKWLTHELFSSNIHFLKVENILNIAEIYNSLGSKEIEGRYYNIPDVEIEYVSGQGKYYGKIPCEMVYIMENETTVENLSMQFLKIIKEKTGLKTGITVKAYEGIAKGSRASI